MGFEMRIALVQTEVSDSALKQNLERVRKFASWAIEKGAQLLLFPELTLTGFGDVDREELERVLNEITEISRHIALGVGTILYEGSEKYNAYVLFSDGEVKYIRKKFMLFEPMKEHEVFKRGEPPKPIKIGDLTFAFEICYELRFPELFAHIFSDVNVFVVPAAWPLSRIVHWRTLLKARAIENLAYVLGVNRWGEGRYGPFGGHSGLVEPNGNFTSIGEGEGMLLVNVDKKVVEGARKFPSFKDRLTLLGTRIFA